jgi:hypothetical protein
VSDLEVKTELDWDVIGRQTVVRVKYRRPPAHRWKRLMVVPDGEQTVADILAHVDEIAAVHEARAASSVPALFWPRTTCVYCGARIPCAHQPPRSIACATHEHLVERDPTYAEAFSKWRGDVAFSAASESRRREGAGQPRNRRGERTRGTPAQRPVTLPAEAPSPITDAGDAARTMRGDEPARVERR